MTRHKSSNERKGPLLSLELYLSSCDASKLKTLDVFVMIHREEPPSCRRNKRIIDLAIQARVRVSRNQTVARSFRPGKKWDKLFHDPTRTIAKVLGYTAVNKWSMMHRSLPW